MQQKKHKKSAESRRLVEDINMASCFFAKQNQIDHPNKLKLVAVEWAIERQVAALSKVDNILF